MEAVFYELLYFVSELSWLTMEIPSRFRDNLVAFLDASGQLDRLSKVKFLVYLPNKCPVVPCPLGSNEL